MKTKKILKKLEQIASLNKTLILQVAKLEVKIDRIESDMPRLRSEDYQSLNTRVSDSAISQGETEYAGRSSTEGLSILKKEGLRKLSELQKIKGLNVDDLMDNPVEIESELPETYVTSEWFDEQFPSEYAD